MSSSAAQMEEKRKKRKEIGLIPGLKLLVSSGANVPNPL